MRDMLLSLAECNLYEPRWTMEILHERERTLKRRRKDLTQRQVESVTIAMNAAFPDALVEIDRSLLERLKLPDKNDLHVLAGAISCGASTIVTANLRDFPRSILSEYGVVAEHPDFFCVKKIKKNPATAIAAFNAQIAALKRPPISHVRLLRKFADLGMVETAAEVSTLLDM